MALTKLEASGMMRLTAWAFARVQNREERKKIFIEFEDIFGREIKDWEAGIAEILKEQAQDEEVLEHFRSLCSREQKVITGYEIRCAEQSDLKDITELINRNFNMMLTSKDYDRYTPFLKSGYSFVICNHDSILGCVLAQPYQILLTTSICIDVLVVGETCRNMGLGKALLQHVQNYAKENNNDFRLSYLRLTTDKTKDAYRFYRHLGFGESDYVTMVKMV